MFFHHPEFSDVDNRITYGFFGREGGVSTGLYKSLNCGYGSGDSKNNIDENRRRVAEKLAISPEHLMTPHQIHSAKCAVIDDPATAGQTECDAFVTDKPGIGTGILTADCTPVLFYAKKADNAAPVIGAAHAGWKGALGGVLESTIETIKTYSVEPDSITAVIGPTIGPNSYEVDENFKLTFEDNDASYSKYFKKFYNKDKYLFDLPKFCEDRLRQACAANVFQMNIDTFRGETRFFSYRRATHRGEESYGRQISAIAIHETS